jgi:hypothetical protein
MGLADQLILLDPACIESGPTPRRERTNKIQHVSRSCAVRVGTLFPSNCIAVRTGMSGCQDHICVLCTELLHLYLFGLRFNLSRQGIAAAFPDSFHVVPGNGSPWTVVSAGKDATGEGGGGGDGFGSVVVKFGPLDPWDTGSGCFFTEARMLELSTHPVSGTKSSGWDPNFPPSTAGSHSWLTRI